MKRYYFNPRNGCNDWPPAGLFAQKYAFVDTEYILENIPAYRAAQEQLDRAFGQYQKELETVQAELEQMYNDFRAESVFFLTI
jgi:outer membrane protein